MTTPRKVVISSLLLFIVLGHGFCLVERKELWPFSCYPMYSSVPKLPFSAFQLRGLGSGSELDEFVLPNTYLLRSPSINNSLKLILLEDESSSTGKLNRALLQLSNLYERERASGRLEIPKIEKIKLYRRTWALNLSSDAPQIDELPQQFIHEVSTK